MCSYERWAGSVPQISRAVFPARILETGLKFHIWTQGEICLGNRAHLKGPVNLSFIMTVPWKQSLDIEKRNPIQYGKKLFS